MPTEIASNIPGRAIHSYDLLDDMATGYDLDERAAHDGIHAALEQLIDLDGEDAVILDRKPVHPELLERNPNSRDVYYWLTISDEAEASIRESFAAMHGERWTLTEAAEHLGHTGPNATGSARRTLSRLGVKAVGRQPGRGGESEYDAYEVRRAHAARPGRGARTDLAD